MRIFSLPAKSVSTQSGKWVLKFKVSLVKFATSCGRSCGLRMTEFDHALELLVQMPGPISINTSSFVCFLAQGIS